jgi:phage terminase large subunit-like protein
MLNDDGIARLNLPAIAEQNEDIRISEDYVWPREEGDLLHPEREDQQALDEMKTNMGSLVFAAQYQQRPAPMDGEIVQKAWFKRYDQKPERLASDFLVQSWDTAQTVTTEADYSVCTIWLIRDDNFYLLDVERFKAQFPDLKNRVIQSGRRYNPNLIIIEAIGAGGALYQYAVRELGSCVRFHKPKVEKKTRMWQESPLIEAGRESRMISRLQRKIQRSLVLISINASQRKYNPRDVSRYQRQIQSKNLRPTD